MDSHCYNNELLLCLLVCLQEGSNVTHIVGHLDTVLSTLAEERTRQNAQQRYSQNPQYLDDLAKRYSKQPSGRPYSSVLTTDI